mgnify:FL=1
MAEHVEDVVVDDVEEIKDVADPIDGKEVKEDIKVNPKDEKKYSDNDVNRIIDKKFKEWADKKDFEVSEAEKLGTMTEKEKAAYERDKLQAELDALKEKQLLADMATVARGMLKDESINISDELLYMIITTDAEKTEKSVKSFAQEFKASVDAQVNEALKRPTPKTGKVGGLTKDDILKIGNEEERLDAIARNIELF